jgi:hypothetical protein
MSKTSSYIHRPGTGAALRGVGKKVFWAYPTIVVQDTPDLIALYMPAGVHGKDVDHHPTPDEFRTLVKIQVTDVIWQWTDVLYLIVPGESFSTYLMWKTGTRILKCVYINLQDPIRRTCIGYDTMDHMLDVVIDPDLSGWKWKDEDELAGAVRVGYYTPEEAACIRRNGEYAVSLITGERRQLYEQWMDWRPDPAWKLPLLPSRWDQMIPKA